MTCKRVIRFPTTINNRNFHLKARQLFDISQELLEACEKQSDKLKSSEEKSVYIINNQPKDI